MIDFSSIKEFDYQEEISRPVINLVDPTLENIEYGEKLSEILNELGMEQKQLAADIGVSEKTVARYLNGENSNSIKKEIKAKINIALNEAMYYKGYKHMTAAEFGKLFEEFWKGFKTEISQEDFAVKAGHGGQSDISQIISGDKLVKSTKEQYDYLIAFYDLCKRKAHYWFGDRSSKLSVFSNHYEAASKLHELLFEYSTEHDIFKDKRNSDGELSVTILNTVIEHLITWPIEAQKLILSYPFAFLDSLAAPNFHHSDGSYISASELIERFRKLTNDEKLRFYADMQKLNLDEKIYNYSYGVCDWFLFDMNQNYNNMINSARQRKIADPIISAFSHNGACNPVHDNSLDSFRSKQDKKIDEDEQRHRFEGVINSFCDGCWENCPTDIITDTIIDDIEYRLSMSPFEWQLWALYSSYVYTIHSDSEIEVLFNKSKFEQGLSIIAEYIISLPFDQQEKICQNPMFFFDSMALCSINSDCDSTISYLKSRMLFEEYDNLSDEEKQQFIKEVSFVRDLYDDVAGYPVKCDYYDDYKEIPIYYNVQSQKEAIVQFLLVFPICTSDEAGTYRALAEYVIDDISYKLSMSQEQWDIWCLFMESVYNMSVCCSNGDSALEVFHTIITAAKRQ